MSDCMVTTLRGWTVKQYAIAAAWYQLRYGELPKVEKGASRTIRYSWSRPYDPGKSPIIYPDEPEPESGYAWDIFCEEAFTLA